MFSPLWLPRSSLLWRPQSLLLTFGSNFIQGDRDFIFKPFWHLQLNQFVFRLLSSDRCLFLWQSPYELSWKHAQDYFCLFLPNSIPLSLTQNFNPSLLATKGFVRAQEIYIKGFFSVCLLSSPHALVICRETAFMIQSKLTNLMVHMPPMKHLYKSRHSKTLYLSSLLEYSPVKENRKELKLFNTNFSG